MEGRGGNADDRGCSDVQYIYPRVVKRLHALVVVVSRVDRVHSDGVDAELSEVGQISRAVLGRRQRVDVRGRFWETTTARVSYRPGLCDLSSVA
jgi:hypothetical protein